MSTKTNTRETEVVKFTEEELEQIQSIQTTYRDITAELGQLQVNRIRLNQQEDLMEQREESLKTNFIDAQKSEQTFVKEITAKYGDGALDPTTGDYIKSNKKTNQK